MLYWGGADYERVDGPQSFRSFASGHPMIEPWDLAGTEEWEGRTPTPRVVMSVSATMVSLPHYHHRQDGLQMILYFPELHVDATGRRVREF